VSKIEYDNFPKFLVSFGIILIALPVLAITFFLKENSVLLVSEENISELTEVARRTITAKQELSCLITDNIAFLSIGCILGGIILLLIGCRMWYVLQKKINDKQEVELQTAKMQLQKMTPEEKENKAKREIMEQVQTAVENVEEDNKDNVLSVEEIRKKQEYIRNENSIIRDNISKRYFEVEETITKEMGRLLMDDYTIMSNMRIGSVEYDLIAKSKISDIDYIFEIKYLFSAYSWNAAAWNQIPSRMQMQKERYTRETNRKAIPILLLITLEDQVEKLKQMVGRRWEPQGMRVKVLSENEIESLTIANIMGN